MRFGPGGLVLCAAAAWPCGARAEPPVRRIDPQASQAEFEVRLRLPIRSHGRFGRIEGELRPAPDQRLSVDVRLPARELTMGGPPWVQTVTHSAQFLDSANYPDIVFRSQPFSPQVLVSGGDIHGRLTIREVSREVVFRVQPATCRQPGVTCPIRAAGTLDRHDFGMHAYRWSLRDEVGFRFQLNFADE